MPLNTKTIKRRIKSISNTKKITKAMEMISAVKMRRAVANDLATRSYANLGWEMLQDIAKKTDIRLHPLLHQRPIKKVGMIYITSNRGLAGGFNSRLLQEAHRYIVDTEQKNNTVILNKAKRSEESLPQSPNGQGSFARAQDDNQSVEVEIILTGKKGKKMYQRFNHPIVAEFDKLDLTTKIEEVLPMVQMVTQDYVNGKYDKVVVAYTDFVSAVQQVPRVKQILPLSEEVIVTPLSVSPLMKGREAGHPPANGSLPQEGEDGRSGSEEPSGSRTRGGGLEAMQDEFEIVDETPAEESTFLFEPGTKQVLDVLLPRLVEMQVFQTILESDASEHSSRMVAMKSASDAAGEMIKELNYSFNKARQAGITREISEIVGGAAALE